MDVTFILLDKIHFSERFHNNNIYRLNIAYFWLVEVVSFLKLFCTAKLFMLLLQMQVLLKKIKVYDMHMNSVFNDWLFLKLCLKFLSAFRILLNIT